MTPPSGFEIGDSPAVRNLEHGKAGHLAGLHCPFCGEPWVKLSDGDLAQDSTRVELYCDNSLCDVREFAIVGLRGEGIHQRADVRALQAIDEGTRGEQIADGYTFVDSGDGTEHRLMSMGDWARAKTREERRDERHQRRQRPTTFEISIPAPVVEDDPIDDAEV